MPRSHRYGVRSYPLNRRPIRSPEFICTTDVITAQRKSIASWWMGQPRKPALAAVQLAYLRNSLDLNFPTFLVALGRGTNGGPKRSPAVVPNVYRNRTACAFTEANHAHIFPGSNFL